jgi:(E)-4-hydroxy-3-methylbut-2-enyl-diphosphate synthase
MKMQLPEAEAVDRLVDLIKEHNKWVEPEMVNA